MESGGGSKYDVGLATAGHVAVLGFVAVCYILLYVWVLTNYAPLYTYTKPGTAPGFLVSTRYSWDWWTYALYGILGVATLFVGLAVLLGARLRWPLVLFLAWMLLVAAWYLGTFFGYHLLQWLDANQPTAANAMNPANDPAWCCSPTVNASAAARDAGMCPVLDDAGCPGVSSDADLRLNPMFLMRMVLHLALFVLHVADAVLVFWMLRQIGYPAGYSSQPLVGKHINRLRPVSWMVKNHKFSR